MTATAEKYVVNKGDTLVKISKQYDVKDWKQLWNHKENKVLNKKYNGDETKISPKDVMLIPPDISPKVAGYPVEIGKTTHTFKSEKERDNFLKTVKVIEVKGEKMAFTPEEWDKFQKELLTQLKRTVVVGARIRADAAESIHTHFKDLNNDQYIVSWFVSLGGPKLPNESIVKKAISHADKIEAAVKSGDFASIKSEIESAEEPINSAYNTMMEYKERVIGRTGTWITGLQVTKTTSFAILAAAATPAGAGFAGAAMAAGSAKMLESSANELGRSIAGANRGTGEILWNIGRDTITAAAVGALLKSKKGEELIKGISGQLAKKVASKISTQVVQRFLEKFLADGGKAALGTAVEQTGKAVNEGTTVKEFVGEVAKSGAIGGVLGKLNDAIDKDYAPAILKNIPKAFWDKYSKCDPKGLVQTLLEDSASSIAQSTLESSLGLAKGSESPQELVESAAARLVKDRAFLEKLEAAAKAK